MHIGFSVDKESFHTKKKREREKSLVEEGCVCRRLFDKPITNETFPIVIFYISPPRFYWTQENFNLTKPVIIT